MAAIDGAKRRRLDDFLAERGLSEVWLLRPANFAWLAGGNSVVDRFEEAGVAALCYDGDGVRALTQNNEVDRIRAEEVPAGVPVDAFDWYADSLPGAVAAASADGAAADLPAVPDLPTVDVGSLRLPLTESEQEAYAAAGGDAAAAVEAVAREVDPDTTEREAAGRLRTALWDRGLEAPVVLVGGADRAQTHRHFTPTDAALGEFGVLTVVGARDGLNVALTRTVAFDPPAWLAERHDAAGRVAATAMAATAAVGADGGTAGDVFDAVRAAYDAVGWPDEWRLHHQGGAIGYASREWVATPDAADPVPLPAPYAWNPTVQGAKVEDTAMASASGVEVVTDTGDWPTRTYEAVDFDVAVDLPVPHAP